MKNKILKNKEDVTNCPELQYLDADFQAPVLPTAILDDVRLSIENPIKLTGAEVRIENISHDGRCTADSIIWNVSGESGKVTFNFVTKLPEGISGKPFSGTAMLPWTKNP